MKDIFFIRDALRSLGIKSYHFWVTSNITGSRRNKLTKPLAVGIKIKYGNGDKPKCKINIYIYIYVLALISRIRKYYTILVTRSTLPKWNKIVDDYS